MYHWGSAARHFEVNECDLTGSLMRKCRIQVSIFLGHLNLGFRQLANKKPCILKFARITSKKTWGMRSKYEGFQEMLLVCDEF